MGIFSDQSNLPAAISKHSRMRSIAALIFFVMVIFWVFFLTQGLPIGDFDDWDHVLVAQDASWGKLLHNFFLPWSPSNHWHGQVDRMNEMMNRRILLTLMIKAVVSITGFHFLPFYLILKALFFAITFEQIYYGLKKSNPEPFLIFKWSDHADSTAR